MTNFKKFVQWNKNHPATFIATMVVLIGCVIAGIVTGGWYCYLAAIVFPLLVNGLNYNAWLKEDQNAPL